MDRLRALNVSPLFDPTHTTTIRLAWVRESNRRFAELKRDIRVSIVDRDCFGMQPGMLALEATASKLFAWKTDPQKIRGFMDWLVDQEAKGILAIDIQTGTHAGMFPDWEDVYARGATETRAEQLYYERQLKKGYVKGITSARQKLNRAGYNIAPVSDGLGGISGVLGGPVHADRIGMIYSRTYGDLVSVLQQTNAAVRRSIADGLTTGLAQGIAQGKNPRVIARELVKNVNQHVDKIGILRARTIARTEVVRAHHMATIAEYRAADEEMQIGVRAEWLTSGLPNVCPECADLEAGGPYTLDWIEMRLPAHPNCRCTTVPAVRSGQPVRTERVRADRAAQRAREIAGIAA